MTPEERALDALYRLGGRPELGLNRRSKCDYDIRDAITGAVLGKAIKYKLHARERRDGKRTAWKVSGTGALDRMRTVRGTTFREILSIAENWLVDWRRAFADQERLPTGSNTGNYNIHV